MIDSVCAARHNSKLLDNQIRFTATIFVFFLLLLFVVELKFGDYRFQLGTNWAQITIIIIFPWGRSLFGTIRMWRAIVCGLTFCSFYLISFARVARSPLQNFLDFIHWWVSTDADYFFIFVFFFEKKNSTPSLQAFVSSQNRLCLLHSLALRLRNHQQWRRTTTRFSPHGNHITSLCAIITGSMLSVWSVFFCSLHFAIQLF